jgi:hypothetical protein
MNNKKRKAEIDSMKELESLMYIPLTLALMEMRHYQEDEAEVQSTHHLKEEVSKE